MLHTLLFRTGACNIPRIPGNFLSLLSMHRLHRWLRREVPRSRRLLKKLKFDFVPQSMVHELILNQNPVPGDKHRIPGGRTGHTLTYDDEMKWLRTMETSKM